MSFSSSRGRMVILGGSGGTFRIFRMSGGPWCKKIGAYAKFGNLQGFKWNFGGLRT
jgi:hypothetical protein